VSGEAGGGLHPDRVLHECPSCGARITATFDQDPVGVEFAIEAHRLTHKPAAPSDEVVEP
jgi:hypothetical protein